MHKRQKDKRQVRISKASFHYIEFEKQDGDAGKGFFSTAWGCQLWQYSLVSRMMVMMVMLNRSV